MNYGRLVIDRISDYHGISEEVNYWIKNGCMSINQYLIYGKLPRESSSELFLATNILDNSNVILKAYHIETSRRKDGSRFFREDVQVVSSFDKVVDEIIILASCNNIKGVIQILETLHDTKFNIIYLIMPYYPTQLLWWNPYGEYYELTDINFKDSVRDENVILFNEKYAKRIIKEIVQTIHSLHKLGIVHKDIKPENILIKKLLNSDSIEKVKIPSKTNYKYSHQLEPLDLFLWQDSVKINDGNEALKYAKNCMDKSNKNKIPLLKALENLNYKYNPSIWNSHPCTKKNEQLRNPNTDYIIITDFGCSSISEPSDDNLSIFDSDGTPAFTGPECIELIDESKGINGESRDIYSIGVTLFVMLYGVLPFSGNSGIQVFINMSDTKFKVPFHTFRNTSDSVKDLLE